MSEYKYNRSGTQYLDNGYIYGNGQEVAGFDIIDEGDDYSYEYEYFHNNYPDGSGRVLGSAQAITNSSGTVSWSRDYYPFGNDKDAGGTGNDYKFTGKEWDEESGLYYFWHRFYDPEIGRFIQVDPMWDKYPSLTPYQYCPIRDSCWSANNPLKFVDPRGERYMTAKEQQLINSAMRQAEKYEQSARIIQKTLDSSRSDPFYVSLRGIVGEGNFFSGLYNVAKGWFSLGLAESSASSSYLKGNDSKWGGKILLTVKPESKMQINRIHYRDQTDGEGNVNISYFSIDENGNYTEVILLTLTNEQFEQWKAYIECAFPQNLDSGLRCKNV